MAPPLQIPILAFSSQSESWQAFEKGNQVQSCHASGKRELKISTWNIWFDEDSMSSDRWTVLFAILFDGPEVLDAVAMQEVTYESWDLLLHVAAVRRDWVVVDYESVVKEAGSWYGTTMLIRKRWLEANGFNNLTAALVEFPSSQGRALLLLELEDAQGIALRIATSHFESLPEDKPFRLRQFKITGNALTLPRTVPILAAEQVTSQVSTPSPQGAENPSTGAVTNAPHAIIVGDTNIYNISELSPLFDAPFEFRDAYALAHDETSSADDHTFGMTFPERWGTKKIDYVLFRPGDPHAQTLAAAGIFPSFMRPVKAALLGRDPIPNMAYRGGKDGKLYPSDHLGVFVWFKGL